MFYLLPLRAPTKWEVPIETATIWVGVCSKQCAVRGSYCFLKVSALVLDDVSAFPRSCLPLSPIVSPHVCLCWMAQVLSSRFPLSSRGAHNEASRQATSKQASQPARQAGRQAKQASQPAREQASKPGKEASKQLSNRATEQGRQASQLASLASQASQASRASPASQPASKQASLPCR